MTYLSDRRSRRTRFTYQLIGVCLLAFTVVFWVQIRIFFSPAMFSVSRGIFAVKMGVINSYDSLHSWFSTKGTLENTIKLLEDENASLRNELAQVNANIAAYDDAFKTSTRLPASTVEVSALYSPLTSMYHSFLISKGFSSELEEGFVVYGPGYVPIGRVIKVGTHTSEVGLLSAPGNELEGIVMGSTTDKTVLRLTGIGGGDYEALLPKEISITQGDIVMWKENPKMKLGVVVGIDNEPQAIAQKLLIRGTYSATDAPRLYIDLP